MEGTLHNTASLIASGRVWRGKVTENGKLSYLPASTALAFPAALALHSPCRSSCSTSRVLKPFACTPKSSRPYLELSNKSSFPFLLLQALPDILHINSRPGLRRESPFKVAQIQKEALHRICLTWMCRSSVLQRPLHTVP